jgi:hypothetical protein
MSIEYKKLGSDGWTVKVNGKTIGTITIGNDDDRKEYEFNSAKGVKPEFDNWTYDLGKLKTSIEKTYLNENAPSKFKDILETSSKYPVYNKLYSDAITSVVKFIKDNGYTYNEDEFFNDITTGPKKPSEGKTNKFNIQMYKDGKETKKYCHIQVYGMKDKYELNMYIS